MPHPCQAPARRSCSASDESREAARMSRKARSAVVSSSTPGVLHTAIPERARPRRRRCCRSRRRRWPPPAAGRRRRLASTAASIRSVRRQTTASTSARRPSSSGDGGAVVGSTSSWPAAISGSIPPSGSGSGDEDPAHSVGGVVDRPGALQPMAKQKQWMGAWSLTGRRLWTLSGGMWTRSPWAMARSSSSMVMMPRPVIT